MGDIFYQTSCLVGIMLGKLSNTRHSSSGDLVFESVSNSDLKKNCLASKTLSKFIQTIQVF